MTHSEALASSPGPMESAEVASKVLRRARVSKMTRALQDRLALANIKISRGWEHRSFASIEPELNMELKRKRAGSNADVSSDASSVVSGHIFSAAAHHISSPMTNPVFSDDVVRSGSSHGSAGSVKRRRTNSTLRLSTAGGRSGARSSRHLHGPTLSMTSWKSTYQLPESSPLRRHQPLQQASFVSEISTTLDSSPSVSEDDDQDIPITSFRFPTFEPAIASSPPRTPSPVDHRSSRARKGNATSPSFGFQHPGKEGADLLLYLAASPSPAVHGSKTPRAAPATPPSRNTPLPSSLMTPGGQALFGSITPHTPSNGFNFADFVNVTPSPAQAAFSRTPGIVKTPVAAREARRRLHEDNAGLATPKVGSASRREGLGMQLGGEL